MAGIEALLTAMYGFYDAIFQPVLLFGPYISLAFFSAVLAALFSIIYWYLLDIEKADEIKDKLSEQQEKMKEARSDDESDKASEHMQKTMQLNQELMKLNLKPMIATMVFVALIFPWLSYTFSPAVALEPVNDHVFEGELEYAGQVEQIQVDNSTDPATVTVNGSEGEIGGLVEAHNIEWELVRFGENGGFFAVQEGLILSVSAKFIDLPFTLPYIGGALNWLGFYILIAMPLTYGFRKLLGVA